MRPIEALLGELSRKGVRFWLEEGRMRMSAPRGTLGSEDLAGIKSRKEEIQNFLERLHDGPRENLPKAERTEHMPLSFAQSRLWFLAQLEGDHRAYHIPVGLNLCGPLVQTALAKALDHMAQRHEVLRTTFPDVNGHGMAQVCDGFEVVLTQVDLREYPTTASEIFEDFSTRPFDLVQSPAFRVLLLQLDETRWHLLINMHHMISDGASINVMIAELSENYHAALQDRSSKIPPLPLQYVDYAQWQRHYAKEGHLEEQLKWWLTYLTEAPHLLTLPTDHVRPAQMSYSGDRYVMTIPFSKQLRERAGRGDVTLFMILETVFALLLQRYSGQSHILIGTPVANRNRPELEGLIGFFANTLVLCNDLGGNPTTVECLHRFKQGAIGAFEHAETPFEQVVDALNVARDLSHSPLFQAMFVLREDNVAKLQLPGLNATVLEPYNPTAKFDITLTVTPQKGDLKLEWEYATDLFELETIEVMGTQYARLLNQVLRLEDTPINSLDLLNEVERAHLLTLASPDPEPNGYRTLLHSQIAACASAHQNHIAVTFENTSLSYGELMNEVHRLANFLRTHGAGPGTRVALQLPRSTSMIISLLAVMNTGAAYLPIAMDEAPQRFASIIKDADPIVLLCHGETSVPCTVIDPARTEDWAHLPAQSPEIKQDPEHPVYLIYTSGSTGKPKGVLNRHAAVCNRLLWMQQAFNLQVDDSVLQKTPYTFDVSVWEFFWPLMTGARLVVARPDGHRDPAYLKDVIGQERITTLHFVPSMLRVFLDEPVTDGYSSLRRVICSGETLPTSLAKRFSDCCEAPLFNLYGPTEAAIDVSWFRHEMSVPGDSVPIGKPIGNTSLYVVNSSVFLTPKRMPGELLIGGVSLARGYYGNPALTAAAFIPNPFSKQSGQRLYRTGDLVRLLPDGNLVYLQRLDGQLKLRGFRIEIGEIERVLLDHENVDSAAVVCKANPKQLIAFVGGASRVEEVQLRQYLEQRLPVYMIPARVVWLDEMLYTKSGKIDRKALFSFPLPEMQKEERVLPCTPIESTLAEIWGRLLGRTNIGVFDNFFELGGDSILSMQIRAQAREAGILLEPKDLFQHQTIAQLAKVARLAEEPVLLEPLPKGPVPLLPIQNWFFNGSPTHWFNQGVLLSVPKNLEFVHLNTAWNFLQTHHDALRMRFAFSEVGFKASYSDDAPVELVLIYHKDEPWGDFVKQQAEYLQQSLNYEHGPLLRIALFMREGKPARHLIVIHHLLVDGVSWRILLEDLNGIYDALSKGRSLATPIKTAHVASWAQRLQSRKQELQQQCFTLWEPTEKPISIPLDMPEGSNLASDGTSHTFELDPETTAQLLGPAPRSYRTGVQTLLITALARSFHHWSEGQSLFLDVETHGRDETAVGLDISRTVGWFTALFPVYLDIDCLSIDKDLKQTKELLRARENQALDDMTMRHIEGIHTEQKAQVIFNYLGQLDGSSGQYFEPAPEEIGSIVDPQGPRRHILEFHGGVRNGRLQVFLGYSKAIHHSASIEQFADYFRAQLIEVVQHCQSHVGVTASDFPYAGLDNNQLDCLIGDGKQIEDIYPLSFMQEGLLFHWLEDSDSTTYFEQLDFVLRTELDIHRFQQCWDKVIARHTILRTHFAWENLERPLQVVTFQHDSEWHLEDLRNADPAEQQNRLESFLKQDRLRGFQLSEKPPIRFALFRLSEQCYHFVWSHHHTILDGWSLPIVFREVFALYEGDELNTPGSNFGEYIAWLQEQDPEKSADWWKRELADIEIDTGLLLPNSSIEKGYTDEVLLRVNEELTDALGSLARAYQVTLNTLLLGAWARLLSCYSGRDRVIFGTTSSGRSLPLTHIQDALGLFIETLPVVSQPDNSDPAKWLRSLRDLQQEREQHGHVSLAKIREWAGLPGDIHLFESLLVFENYPVDTAFREGDLPFEVDHFRGFERTHYPLTLIVVPGKTISLSLGFRTDRYQHEHMQRLLGHLVGLLTGMVRTPDVPIKCLSPLSEEDRASLLAQCEGGPSLMPIGRGIHQLFEARVALHPKQISLYTDTETLTYEVLNKRANRLAHHLRAHGAGPDVLVGILLPREARLIVAMLAVLKAGAAYVPMDPSYPAAHLVHYQKDLALMVGEKTAMTGRGVTLNEPLEGLECNPDFVPFPEQLSHVIYTSGSTGLPKGVALSHQSTIAMLMWARNFFRAQDFKGVFAATSVCFDLSVFEVFAPLAWGGSIILADNAMAYQDHPLAKNVTLLNTVPSAAQGLLATSDFVPPSVVNLAGEALSSEVVSRLYERGAERVNNLYGPSEDTTYSTGITVAGNDSHPPIGRPIPGTTSYVLDRHLDLLPLGVAGELCLGGQGLARGYQGQGSATALRFVPDPFSLSPGARIYRTGDLVRYRGDGVLEYLERLDHQLKVRGFRVEAGHIEALLSAHPAIEQAVVAMFEGALAAWFVGHASIAELAHELVSQLPRHMVPTHLIPMKCFPLTPNGKIDRRALPAPHQSSHQGVHAAPRSERERLLVDIWQQVLGRESVSIHDNYFSLGGDSIISIQIVGQARSKGFQLKPNQLFQCPTIAQLAPHLTPIASQEFIHAEGEALLTPMQNWFFEQDFNEPHHFNQALLLAVPTDLQFEPLNKAWQHLFQVHDTLHLRFSKEPPGQYYSEIESINTLEFHQLNRPDEMELIAERIQASLDLGKGPIGSGAFCRIGNDEARLMLVFHHLVVDGVSWRILLQDMMDAYQQILVGNGPETPAKTASLQSWTNALQSLVKELDESFWNVQNQDLTGCLPVDFPEIEDLVIDEEEEGLEFSPAFTSDFLHKAQRTYHTKADELLLAALSSAWRDWTGLDSLFLHVERHGRDLVPELDVSRTVGWFTSLTPTRLSCVKGGFAHQVKHIKEHLRNLPSHELLHSLCYLSSASQYQNQVKPPVVFNYLGQTAGDTSGLFSIAPESIGFSRSRKQRRPYGLEIVAIISQDQLRIALRYSCKRFEQSSIAKFANVLKNQLEQLLDHCLDVSPQLTPSDVPLAKLNQTQLDALPDSIIDLYPLSPVQAGMLFHSLSEPYDGTYFQQISLKLQGPLNQLIFKRAWTRVIERHPVLRTVFPQDLGARPLQAVMSKIPLHWHEEDWNGLPEEVCHLKIEQYLAEDRKRGFNLEEAPLMRFMLAETGAQHICFVWSFHHLLLDGWSLPLVLRDVMDAYRALNAQKELNLLPVTPFYHYIQWLNGRDEENAREYWTRRLATGSNGGSFPRDPRAKGEGYEEIELSLASDIGINTFTRRRGITLSTLMRGAWFLLLHHYGAGKQPIFGATVSGRPTTLAGSSQMVGMLINTLPVTSDLGNNPIITQWLQSLQHDYLQDEAFGFPSLASIKRWTGQADQQLFDSLLIIENYPLKSVLNNLPEGLHLLEMSSHEQSNFPLTLAIIPGENIRLKLTFANGHLLQQGALRLLHHFNNILIYLCQEEYERVRDIQILNEGERRSILLRANHDYDVPSSAETLATLLERCLQQYPGQTALVSHDGEHSWTYEELHRDASYISAHLRSYGVIPGTPVGLCLKRQPIMVIAVIAIWYAGGTLVALDPLLPDERRQAMIAQTDLNLVLVSGKFAHLFPSQHRIMLPLNEECPDKLGTKSMDVTSLHPAYISFTSGSTGEPKGVIVSHQAIVNRLLWAKNAYSCHPGDRVLLNASFQFDIFFWEMVGPLLSGATVVIASPGAVRDGNALLNLIQQHVITHIHLVPSLLRVLLEVPEIHKARCLHDVYCGGEALTPTVRQRFHKLLPARLVHFYGPTEAAISMTSWLSDPMETVEPVPLGHCIQGMKIHILNELLEPVPLGVKGRIYIGGTGLAQGYVGKGALTAERFIPDPHTLEPGLRLYDSGDLGRNLDNSGGRPILQFLGRADRQLKLKGHRIEPGEIEQTLLRHKAVQDCFVTTYGHNPNTRLLAYVVSPENGNPLLQEKLTALLESYLPSHMVPTLWMPLAQWPLNVNGKLDYKRLPLPKQKSDKRHSPRNDKERQLARIQAKCLGLEEIGIHDNFFELGGDSILCIQFVAQARRHGWHFTPMQVYEAGTVAKLAAIPQLEKSNACEQGPVVGAQPLSPLQLSFFDETPVHPNRFSQWVYLVTPEYFSIARLPEVLQFLTDHHDALRLKFERTPGGISARYCEPGKTVPLETLHLASPDPDQEQALAWKLHETLDPFNGVMFCAGLVRLPDHKRLLLVAHHLVVDAVSWRILLNDLDDLNRQASSEKQLSLPEKTHSFQLWTNHLIGQATELKQTNRDWWLQTIASAPDVGQKQHYLNHHCTIRLSKEQTERLLKKSKRAYNTDIVDLLLCALARTPQSDGQDGVLVYLEHHGRDPSSAMDISRTVGWFTAIYPVWLPNSTEELGPHVKVLKEMLRGVPGNRHEFQLMRFFGASDTLLTPREGVLFNYLGQMDDARLLPHESLGSPNFYPWSPYSLTINTFVNNERLTLEWSFDSEIHSSDMIETKTQTYKRALISLIDHCCEAKGGFTPADFPLVNLDQTTLDLWALSRDDIQDIYPLSPLQSGMVYHSRADEDDPAYFEQFSGNLVGLLERTVFLEAWKLIVDRYDVLRTGVVISPKGHLLQQVHRQVHVPYSFHDLSHLPLDERLNHHHQLLEDDRKQGFNLEQAPLMRLMLVRLEDKVHRLTWSHHHLIMDGWSMPIVFRELFEAYEALLQGLSPSWSPVLPFRNYIEWLDQQEQNEAKEWWSVNLRDFAGNRPIHVRNVNNLETSDTIKSEAAIYLDVQFNKRLKSFTRANHLTLNTIMQGAWGLLLSRYQGDEDVLFGTTVSGRACSLSGVEKMVGLLLNTIPIRLRLENQSLYGWLEQLRNDQVVRENFATCSLSDIHRWSELPIDRPFFESLLVVENYPIDQSLAREGAFSLKLEDLSAFEQTNFPLSLTVEPGPTTKLCLHYDHSFDHKVARRMLGHFRNMLWNMIESDDVFLDSLSMFDSTEMTELTSHWHGPEPLAALCPLSSLWQFAEAKPQHPALEILGDSGEILETLTYSQLAGQVTSLAHHLSARGLGPERIAALLMPRNATAVISYLAVLHCGGTIMPLDPAQGRDRIESILKECSAFLVLTDGEIIGQDAVPNLMIIPQEIEACIPVAPVRVSPQNSAYIIYTSGTQGTPKGVVATWEAAKAHTSAIVASWQLNAQDRVLVFTAMHFDVFTEQIFSSLCMGATVVMRGKETWTPELCRFILKNQRITVADLPPSYGQALFDESLQEEIAKTRLLVFGGEALPNQLLKSWSHISRNTSLINAYGPTEATVTATIWKAYPGSAPRIGLPLPGRKAMVLDRHGFPVPQGVPGQLYLSGCLTRGYINQPRHTAPVFTPDPTSNKPGGRLYATGDEVFLDENGELFFLGRIDRQIKLRGFRIEPGEIEIKLESHTQINRAVVRQEQDGSQSHLAAYLVTDENLDISEVISFLEGKLPKYMIPTRLALLSVLPITPSGKLDVSALPEPMRIGSRHVYRPPETPTQELLVTIWQEVLQLERVGIDDNFFDVGGHSLSATRMVSRIGSELDLTLSPRFVFEEPTIVRLSVQIDQLIAALNTSNGLDETGEREEFDL